MGSTCSVRTFRIALEQYHNPQHQSKRQQKYRLDIHTILLLPPSCWHGHSEGGTLACVWTAAFKGMKKNEGLGCIAIEDQTLNYSAYHERGAGE